MQRGVYNMKYIIEENKKCLFVDDDKERLINTLMFLPDYTEEDIKEVEDYDLELSYTGDTYLRGYAPIQPTDEFNEQQSKLRSQAYIERTDPLTLRKMRKQALNEWTEEDEINYINEIQRITEEINIEYPYKEVL
jgi:hypothetical protein